MLLVWLKEMKGKENEKINKQKKKKKEKKNHDYCIYLKFKMTKHKKAFAVSPQLYFSDPFGL